MTLRCPRCQSIQIDIKNYAKRVCSLIGAVAGAASVAAGIARGAEIGAAGGMLIGGPGGAMFGSIAGAIIGGLVGGATGGATGAKLGEFMDDNILSNYHCLSCQFNFDKKCASLHEDEDQDDERGYFHMCQGGHARGFGQRLHDPHEEDDPEPGYY